VRLLERDRELDLLTEALRGAAGGPGLGVAVSGEPGAGKTALVAAACERVAAVRFLRGGCDPLATPRPLGPFRDLFAQLGSLDPDAALAEVCEATYDALRAEPTVLVVEDLHWVDAASVEVLRFLVRRLESASYTIVVTYRDDEISAQHSARPLLGDFAALEQLVTLRLAPLSVDAVADLIGDAPLDPVDVHRLTGGNPFFVEEVAKDPDRPLPANVRDVVLARVSEMAPADLEVLQLAAAAPDHLDDRVMPALGVDLPTLRRLFDCGLLLRDRYGLVFRHELARLAVESTIPVGGAARLHGRLLSALETIGRRDPAVLTHHAVAAADARRATTYADEAAQEAARSGSHTEAVAFLQIALEHLGSGHLLERAQLLTRLAQQQYLTSHLDDAIASVTATFPLWREVGDPAGLSAAHAACAVYEYYNARRRQAEDHAERAASLVCAQPGLEYGDARAIRGYLAYHRSDDGLAEQCRADAAEIADRVGDEPLGLRSLMVGAVTALALGEPGARERCVSVIEVARAAGLDELASTGYSNLAYLDVEHRRLTAAERVLEESLTFALERDIPICHHWQTGVRSRLRLLEGRWEASLEDAADALGRAGMPVATVWPHVVSGQIAMRRGENGDAHLEAAWELAERLDEPLRRLPVLSALAERMWLTGAPDDRVTTTAPLELERAGRSSATVWAAGDLVVWLCRLGLPRAAVGVAEPYQLMLAGRHVEAASWWGHAGAVFEEAMANVDGSSLDRQLAAIERLDLHGATATADRVRRAMREEGVVTVPQRRRASTRANPAGLTNRQLDVARLVARGLTNAEIASRLFISPKTTDHHVSAVLMKLGMPSRRAVVVQAEQLGLV
jgi:DNA-binding CsgD family transcriptional regulator/tetratricopeptide (TPR) repeat protein